MTKHDWSVELVRACVTCDGSGMSPRTPSSGPGQASYAQSPGPLECPTCGGRKEERKRLTLVDLAAKPNTLKTFASTRPAELRFVREEGIRLALRAALGELVGV